MMETTGKRKPGRPPGPSKRKKSRYGASPYSSPMAGDVFQTATTGITRVVVGCRSGLVDYYVEKDGQQVGETRTVKQTSWAVWCSQKGAECIESKTRR